MMMRVFHLVDYLRYIYRLLALFVQLSEQL